MKPTQSQSEPIPLTIEGIDEPVVLNYFSTLNARDYQKTAALFSPSGELHAPFEKPIVGREAIATYLEAEAKGMKLQPRQGILELREDDLKEIKVSGKVHTPVFGVNVAWTFLLDSNQEILAAQVKLLASPQELLNLRDQNNSQSSNDQNFT